MGATWVQSTYKVQKVSNRENNNNSSSRVHGMYTYLNDNKLVTASHKNIISNRAESTHKVSAINRVPESVCICFDVA